MKSRSNSIRSLLGAGLAICTIFTASAQNPVTFSIDLSAQSPSDVAIKGSFDGWGAGLALTNDGSGIWSGTTNIFGNAGDVVACKFMYNPGGSWEDDPNRQFILTGSAQTLPLTGWKDQYGPTNFIAFQVDMTAQISLGNYIPGQPMQVTGSFKNPRWQNGAQIDLTNNSSLTTVASNIYSGTVGVVGISNSIPREYKFRANNGWESIGNRSFILYGTNQTLPLVFYNNIAPTTPTNYVKFQVDMTAQVLGGGFVPGTSFLRVSGDFPGGANDGIDLTNNPALNGNESNIWSQVVQIIAEPNTFYKYKFRLNGAYENPGPGNGYPPFNDRGFFIVASTLEDPQELPVVYYSDASPCDLLTQDTTVTFMLHLTNGTVATDGTTYDGSQTIHINGDFINWNGGTWDVFLPQMVNQPPLDDDLYEYQVTILKGKPVKQEFKFSIGGADNEAPSGQNHIQYIRSTSGTYTMPVAEFGTNYASVRVQQALSGLSVGAPSGGNIPVSWDFLPCTTLQVRSNLSTGVWIDLPVTEGITSTNWPMTGGSQFFRLQKRP